MPVRALLLSSLLLSLSLPLLADDPEPAEGDARSPSAKKLADYLELDSSLSGVMVKNFDLPDKDIKDVVTLISKWTGKNFILDAKTHGKITIVGPSQVTLQEAYQAFLSALESNGLTTIQEGKFIRIIDSTEARHSAVQTYIGNSGPADAQVITSIFQLKYINAAEVQKDFKDLISKNGSLFAYEPTNSIIVTDTGANIQKIRKILGALDVKNYEAALHVVKIKHGSAKAISDMLAEIYGDSKGQDRFRQRSVLERTRGGGIITKIIPDEQTNSLLILANKEGMGAVQAILDKIDVKSDDTGKIHVYFCKFAKAEDLAATLQAISTGGTAKSKTSSNPTDKTGSATKAGPISAELENGAKLTSDPSTNSIVVNATASDYKTIKEVLETLDIPKLQVFIQTAILELNVNKNDLWNPNLGFLAGKSLVGGLVLDPLTVGKMIAGTDFPKGLTAPLALTNGELHMNVPGYGVQRTDLVGFINWIKTNGQASDLSTPQVLALDNEKAILKVENNVPILSGYSNYAQTPAAPGAPPTPSVPNYSVDYKKVGINIEITPHVSSASDSMRLEIKQSVSNINGAINIPKDLQDISVATTERTTETQLMAKNDDFIVLGGLVTDSVTETIDKVPLLGDLPLLGWFFKRRNYIAQKTNLVLILQPHIIKTSEDSGEVLDRVLEKREELKREEFTTDDPGEKYILDMKEEMKAVEEDR